MASGTPYLNTPARVAAGGSCERGRHFTERLAFGVPKRQYKFSSRNDVDMPISAVTAIFLVLRIAPRCPP
ncbi:MAG: hypothetical protein DLM70_10510 [Chloroflexi bacterium]|nr:MAG: hypothetical protein DLM70_10510 [Chloroflexota bacterium]